jgi:hypothetical protein
MDPDWLERFAPKMADDSIRAHGQHPTTREVLWLAAVDLVDSV